MARQAFKLARFRPKSIGLIAECNQIITAYQAQDLQLTLRQLYYQLVVRNTIRNTEREYKNLGRLISEARLAGQVDWSAIEDRIRIPKEPAQWQSPASIIDASVRSYKLPRWADQPYHVELWVEKDALAGVLQPIATRRHIILMVNRGYSSQSAMYDTYARIEAALDYQKDAVILYLGDLDPSGEDMVRDIDDRLNVLYGTEVKVRKLAITMDQVQQYSPPPNPAKMSDSRAAKFVDRFGFESYEVDALPPEVLTQIIDDAIDDYEDPELMEAVKAQEDQDKALLRELGRDVMKRRNGGS